MIFLALFLCLFCAKSTLAEETMRVLRSDLDLLQRNKAISGARLLDNRQVDMRDFSICLRFNFPMLHRSGQGFETPARVVSIQSWRENPSMRRAMNFFWLTANHPNSFLGFGHPNVNGSYRMWLIREPSSNSNRVWRNNEWHHFCFSFAKNESFVKFAKDGDIMNINNEDQTVQNATIPADILQNVYLARCAFDYNQRCSATGGRIADLNIWDRPLTTQEMESFTSCSDMSLRGDVVDWATARFELANMSEIYESVESICQRQVPGDVLFPEPRNFTAHLAICNKMRGVTGVVNTRQKEQNFLSEASNKSFSACGNTTRFWYEPNGGTFKSASEDQTENLDELSNDLMMDTCVVLSSEEMEFNDIGCENEICGFCQLDYKPVLKIRGLCSDTRFDQRYSWTGATINERFAFFGITNSLLYFDSDQSEWKLQLHSQNDTYAVLKEDDYPFGTNEWTVFNDRCTRGSRSASVTTVMLNLNNCFDNEFNCDDGTCIPMGKRCDGRVQCPDRSDEIGCRILSTDSSYLNFMPPPGTLSEPLFPVEISVDVLNVLRISEVENFIRLQLRVHLTWRDSRLRMNNLKNDFELNSLTQEMRNQLWIPEIVFYNTDEMYESLDDDKAAVNVHRNGSFKRSPTSSLQNSYIFQGRDNPITLSRVYSFKFLCEFDMRNYPFDTQKCSADLVMKGNLGKFVKLTPKELHFIGPVDLKQYFVRDFEIFEHEILSGVMGVKVQLVFARQLLSTMLIIFLPTVLICLVAFSTNFYKGFFFEAIVTVNLTSLLLLVTLFVSVSQSLPKTAYIKAMDIWLIFILFVPFTEVFVHTIIDNLRTDEERDFHHNKATVNVSEADVTEERGDNDNKRKRDNKIHIKEGPPHSIELHVNRDERSQSRMENTDDSGFVSEEEKRRRKNLKMAIFLAQIIMPLVFLAFCVAYAFYALMIYGTDPIQHGL